jgi:hypothetical protein
MSSVNLPKIPPFSVACKAHRLSTISAALLLILVLFPNAILLADAEPSIPFFFRRTNLRRFFLVYPYRRSAAWSRKRDAESEPSPERLPIQGIILRFFRAEEHCCADGSAIAYYVELNLQGKIYCRQKLPVRLFRLLP